MHLSEIEMADSDFSVQELKKQLFTSLQCTGILDSLKSQLRVRLLDHLRQQDGSLLENKEDRKPSVTERLLSSLFLDYLNSYGYAFTQSVFLPESRMVSWPPYTYQEILQLLHLDSTRTSNNRLKITPDGRSCLMHQLVMVLQKFSFHVNTNDVSIQTQDLDSCLREIDDTCYKRQESQRLLAVSSLEDRFSALRQEFETRVNGEVALQVNRVREYETNALRMEEACRYRRQLAKDREELEELYKARLERVREREESLMERLRVKDKAIEAGAYEQRQKLLADITSLRDREDNLREREEKQIRREEKLDELEKYLKLRQEDICHMRETLYARVDESASMKIKELEEQYRSKTEQLQSDRSLLEAKWAAFHEEKARLGNELREATLDRELVISLHERLASEGEQRQLLLDQIENICQRQKQKWAHEQKKMKKTISKLEADLKKAVEENEGVVRSRKALQVQLRHSESELLDTVTLLKKTQHALELERLHHYSLRSQIATYFSYTSEDKLQKGQEVASFTVDLNQAIPQNTSGLGAVGRTSRATNSLDKEAGKCSAEIFGHQLSPSQKMMGTKSLFPTSPGPYSQKSLLVEEILHQDPFPRERLHDQVRLHQDHSQPSDVDRAASLRSPQGERGESSSADICSTSSKDTKVNFPRGQRCGITSNYTDSAEKNCFHSTTSDVDSLTAKKSAGGAQMTSSSTTSRKPSQQTKPKTKSTGSWEPNQSRTNYYVMGTTSLKNSTSALEYTMMGKAVKLSTSVDHDHSERMRTEVYETKFQQNIKKKTTDVDSDRQRWNQVPPETRDQSNALLMRSQESQHKGNRMYEDHEAREDKFSSDSSDARQKQTSRKEEFLGQQRLQQVNPQKEKPTQHSRSLETREQPDGKDTSQAPGFLGRHNSASSPEVGIGVKPEVAVANFEQNRVSERSCASAAYDIDCEINAHGLSAMVLEDLKRFSRQLEVTKSLMTLEKPPDLHSLGLRTDNKLGNPGIVNSGTDEQQQATLHHVEDLESTTARQLLGETGLLQSVSQKHYSAVATDQKENVLEQHSLSSDYSCSKILTFENTAGRRSTQKTNNTGQANSEESCSNPIVRTPTVKNSPEVPYTRDTDPEAKGNLQKGAQTAEQDTQRWDMHSEQGSHNPEQDIMEWVDDYASGDTDQYVEYSDVFSVPESNNTPSNESGTAGFS